MKSPLLRRLLVLAVFLLILSTAREAEARRGIVLINTGEDVMEVAELPQETLELLAEAGIPGRPQIGLMYSRFGLFWLDIVRWDAQFVIYTQDSFDEFSYEPMTVDELVELTGMSAAEFKKPTRYYLPPGGVLLGLLVIGGVPFYVVSQKRGEQRRTTLMADPRYQAAVAQYNDHSQIPDDGERLGAVIDGLSGQGIPAQEARDNIVFLCGIETQD